MYCKRICKNRFCHDAGLLIRASLIFSIYTFSLSSSPFVWLKKKKMWYLSENMGAFNPSTTLDLLAGNPMEVKYIFRKPLDRAKELGIETPVLETLVIQIEATQNAKSNSNDMISMIK